MKEDQGLTKSGYFWVVVVMLIICGFFHYFVTQAHLMQQAAFPMTRQAVVRIIFLLPVAAAAFGFGLKMGLVTLAVSVLIMLPRALFISAQPLDALFEILAVAIVGCLLVWMIDVQEREKKLRQRVVEELETVNAIALTLTQPHDLDAMLEKTLDRVSEVIGIAEPAGAILLLDPWGRTLHVRAYRGQYPEFVESVDEVPLYECLCWLTAESGEVLVVEDALNHPRHVRCVERDPHTHVCVPLKSKDRLLGVMEFYLPENHQVDAIDRKMLAAIGRQIGVAVENARLCENLRFYAWQTSQAQEEERRRIARELHDDTAQQLVALSRYLDTLADSEENLSEAGVERLEQLQRRIEGALQGVRRFSRDLRPSVLDDLGLLPALEGLLSDLEGSGISPELRISGDRRRLSPDVELALFRIVQETLNNVRRHANASHVMINVEFRNGWVKVDVRDDGQGFELLGSPGDFASAGKFGLLGIEERAQLLHGQFRVHSGKGEGTTVTVDVPIEGRPPQKIYPRE
ncbi:MAG: GAF domain-containing protein [Anaerolineae bacterium]|jgi:signal transduction histidine kinase